MEEIKLSVTGMSCGHCKKSVETALNDLTGVKSAEVDLDAEVVSVEFDESALEESELKKAIEAAGPYQVK